MNNNRNNNRRGRGRNTNRNQGGGNAANRIDSRARGNAPQLLDKYKKLAQDAQHNGDRVQAEYYLQFADHYFRVIADNKARQDEARAKRQDDRGDNSDDNDDDDGDDRRNNRRTRGRYNDDDGDNNDRHSHNGRSHGRGNRDDDHGSDEGQQQNEGEQGDNPFTRETKRPRKPQASKPRTRKPATKKAGKAGNDAGDNAGAIDASALPPAIGGDEAAKPKRAPRSRKPTDDGEAAKAAG